MKSNWTGFIKSAVSATVIFFASLVPALASQSVSLGWDASASADVTGYIVHYGAVSQNQTNIVDVGNVITAVVPGLMEGVEYFFYVTAYNSAAVESDPSNSITYTVAAPLLADIADQSIQLGQTLRITASATIGGSVATGVVFSLGAGTPDGVSINPSTGEISWTPSAAQAPSANIITVAVAPVGSATISDLKSFNVTVTSAVVNQAPVARTDKLARYATQGAKVSVQALLRNDSDPDGDPLTIIGVSPTTMNGASVTMSSGWVFYVPNGFTGGDSFTYTVSDGRGGTATGTVFVFITNPTQAINVLSISTLDAGGVRIKVNGTPGVTYTVQYADFATPNNWQVLGEVTVTAVGSATIDDASGVPLRMFRSVSSGL